MAQVATETTMCSHPPHHHWMHYTKSMTGDAEVIEREGVYISPKRPLIALATAHGHHVTTHPVGCASTMLDAGSQARLRVKCEKGTGGHDWLPFQLLRLDCHYHHGHEMDIPFCN
eukprot:scaffold4488_cov185-Alexandrium_tamarense.AAC.21